MLVRLTVCLAAIMCAAAGTAAMGVASASLTPRVSFSMDGPGDVNICFSNLPYIETDPDSGDFEPRVAGTLRVDNIFTRNGSRAIHKSARVFRFDARRRSEFSTDTYDGFFDHGYLTGEDDECLRFFVKSPWWKGHQRRESQVGTFRLTVNSKGARIGSASYRYAVKFTPGELIREGTDDFFNYCLSNPEARIFSSGGVLYCQKPGSATIAIRRE